MSGYCARAVSGDFNTGLDANEQVENVGTSDPVGRMVMIAG